MSLRFLTAGESHGPAVTAILEGLPAGLSLPKDVIDKGENIFLAASKGELKKLIKSALDTKPEKLEKMVDEEIMPVKIKGIGIDQSTNLIYFMSAIENYKSGIKTCLIYILSEKEKTKNKSKDFKKYIKKIKKYGKNPPIDDSDIEYRKMLDEKASKGEDLYSTDLYLKSYSKSMISKGEAALYLCKFMFRTGEYKSEDMINIVKYGIKSLNEAYSKLPEGKKYERLTPVGMGLAAKKNTLKKLKKALSQLKRK